MIIQHYLSFYKLVILWGYVKRKQWGNARAVSDELADSIVWNLPRGRSGNGRNSDPVVDKACQLLVQGKTVLIEELEAVTSRPSAYVRVNLIRGRLGNRVQSTALSDIQAEGLQTLTESDLIPRFVVRLRPIEKVG